MSHRPKSPTYYMPASGSKDDDDEDAYHPHVVLTPSLHPYNKDDKIKEANMKLKKEQSLEAGQKTSKVRFKEVVTYDDEVLEDDEEDEFQAKETLRGRERRELSISKPCSKILLVTVPTGFSNESEEVITDDEDCEEDNDLVNDGFRPGCGSREKRLPCLNSEEEIDEATPPLTEDTFSSSLDTVLYRSETEDSDLTEVFSRSVNINPEPEEDEVIRSDSDESLETLDFLSLFKEEISSVENGNVENENVLQKPNEDNIVRNRRPSTAISVSVFRKSSLKTSSDESKQKDMKSAESSRSCSELRPSTAPVKRVCCKMSSKMKLPSYNGLRSEYGMSAEQLRERDKRKMEIATSLRQEKEKKYMEQRVKRKENELTFNNWLIKKKREAEARALRRMRQSNYCYRRTIPAPTAHLDRIGILRRKILKRENTCFLLNEIFRNAKPHEQKTYRIYLGLGSE